MVSYSKLFSANRPPYIYCRPFFGRILCHGGRRCGGDPLIRIHIIRTTTIMAGSVPAVPAGGQRHTGRRCGRYRVSCVLFTLYNFSKRMVYSKFTLTNGVISIFLQGKFGSCAAGLFHLFATPIPITNTYFRTACSSSFGIF